MNWQHLQAFIWLRWRLLVNQLRRAGFANAVLLTIVTIGLVALSIPLFIVTFLVAQSAIPKAAPEHLLYAWDGVIVAFLFFWCIGLLTELQRTEPMALSKFLHLPVSVNGAFLINYLSSLCRLSLIIFGPVMLAFALALALTKGIVFVAVFLLLAAFLLMVTALTYQFQGWLAALMSNPRRRRTVIVAATMTFVLLVQLPNLINFFAPWGARRHADRAGAVAEETEKLGRELASKQIDQLEYLKRLEEIRRRQFNAIKSANQQTAEQFRQGALIANMVLPFGWLPLGVMSMAEGRFFPAMLGLLGMTAIGAGSLYRAYRTTVGLYQGVTTDGTSRRARPVAKKTSGRERRGLIVETKLPGLSEPVSVIALAGFRSLLRSPEAKMMLLSPLIMIPIFGSMLWSKRETIPEQFRPLIAIGGMAIVLMGMMQLMANQFGFDRDGFRVFVLSAARRRDILFGKNLAFAPLALGIAAILLVILQVVCPMRVDHFLASVFQYIAMFLVYCVLMNLVSILTPTYVAPGSLKPSNPKAARALLQFALIFFLLPLTIGPTLLPFGAETLLRLVGWPASVPTYLILSLVQLAIVGLVYLLFLELEGGLFETREQAILESVTSRVP